MVDEQTTIQLLQLTKTYTHKCTGLCLGSLVLNHNVTAMHTQTTEQYAHFTE